MSANDIFEIAETFFSEILRRPQMNLEPATIYMVRLYFVGGGINSHMVEGKHVPKFVMATYQLHFEPGVNPHNGMKLEKVVRITYAPMVSAGKADISQLGGNYYWWSTPGLETNGDCLRGAAILNWDLYALEMGAKEEVSWGEEDDAWLAPCRRTPGPDNCSCGGEGCPMGDKRASTIGL
jgi:hypothetical protein